MPKLLYFLVRFTLHVKQFVSSRTKMALCVVVITLTATTSSKEPFNLLHLPILCKLTIGKWSFDRPFLDCCSKEHARGTFSCSWQKYEYSSPDWCGIRIVIAVVIQLNQFATTIAATTSFHYTLLVLVSVSVIIHKIILQEYDLITIN